jgi:predicted nucleic acid-binding protein
MKVVSNTSPLIALAKIDHLLILQKLFQNVFIPQSVADEFFRNCMTDEKANFEDACRKFIEVVKVKESHNFNRRLDEGEQDALTLAIQKKAIIIIDDRKGSNEAKDQKLIPVSTRAVLRIAEEKKIIRDYHKLENSLRKRSFFLPDY